ncbi:head-tail adaptor protein [Siccirubricoccus sp. KC 17139]|uniref:Head-tail adaptor protein n=1 Tax=Siccirubricoccus soli TaxID=2899147 RepID=A0ABT1CYT1_9PROT|nr:head-tail adaptor protein [Siccirubricoccus soli]MCO6414811.1 head-tail adaptor protein [Siccirubricoccus soli]MCP2680941.1 head-tail adaptor protein [Siccirubricoccus soli]
MIQRSSPLRVTASTPNASIKPVGTMAYIQGQQIDVNSITHRIIVRWRDGLDQFYVIRRDIPLPDGSTRQELYRIHRVSEMDGRRRFLTIDAELEKQSI